MSEVVASLRQRAPKRSAPGRSRHGLVVVGSHVGLTSRQLAALQERARSGDADLGEFRDIELDVERLLDADSRESYLAEKSAEVRAALADAHVILATSRTLIKTDSKDESLAIARYVSDAVVAVVREARAARPAWVVAKGGITSHEVTANGLGIRRATVAGQSYPGQISMFTATNAPADVLGVPYVVFPGNVGGPDALADVVARIITAQAAAPAAQENRS